MILLIFKKINLIFYSLFLLLHQKTKATTTKKHIEKCSIQIISEPNGLFSEHCSDKESTNKAQFIDIRQTHGTGANKIIITNSGNP